MSTVEQAPGQAAGVPTCYRHPKRETYLRCSRCDRSICPDCMHAAAVGQHCPDCLRSGRATVRPARAVFGGRVATRPAVTWALVAANAAAYLGELVSPGVQDRFAVFGVAIASGQWYRLLTGSFIHALPFQGPFGIAHILLNLVSLWLLGPAVEQAFGRLRFLALYLLAALGSSVFVYLIAPLQGAMGASGAIFGVAAAYFVLSRRLGRNQAYANQLMVWSLVWLVVAGAFTSWEGHLGGLLTGGALAAAYAYAPAKRRGLVQGAATAGLVVLLVVLAAAKTAQLRTAIL